MKIAALFCAAALLLQVASAGDAWFQMKSTGPYEDYSVPESEWVVEDVVVDFTYIAPAEGDITVGPCWSNDDVQSLRLRGSGVSAEVYMDITYNPGTELEEVFTIKVSDSSSYSFERTIESQIDGELPDIFLEVDYDHDEYFGTCANLDREVSFGSYEMEDALLPPLEDGESVDDVAGLNIGSATTSSNSTLSRRGNPPRCAGNSQGRCVHGGHNHNNGQVRVGCGKRGPHGVNGHSRRNHQGYHHRNHKGNCKRNSRGRCRRGNREVEDDFVEDVILSETSGDIYATDYVYSVDFNAPHSSVVNPTFTIDFWSPNDYEEGVDARDPNGKPNRNKHRHHGNKHRHKCHGAKGQPGNPGTSNSNGHPQG